MELRQYLAVVRKYLWLILLTTLLATGSAFYFSYTAPPVYRATTTLEIDLGTNPLSDPYAVSNVRTVKSVTEIFSARIQFPLFIQQVKDRLDLPYRTPCQAWVQRLERDIGLTRSKGEGRVYVWRVSSNP